MLFETLISIFIIGDLNSLNAAKKTIDSTFIVQLIHSVNEFQLKNVSSKYFSFLRFL